MKTAYNWISWTYNRTVVMPNMDYYLSRRDEVVATLQPPGEKKKSEPTHQDRLRNYARMGVQFDLPLFRYPDRLEYAKVKKKNDKEWNGRLCDVFAITGLGGVNLGAGTMLGFTSWSYVHSIRPQSETLYIDKERGVLLHETLISDRDDKRKFEIDFKDYVGVEPGQWAPMRIEIVAKDYFTCQYDFQLTVGKHWMLKKAVSWFKPEDKSVGEILDLRINQRSEFKEGVLSQIDATSAFFSDSAVPSEGLEISTFPFRVGKWIPVSQRDEGTRPDAKDQCGINKVLFTLEENGDLAARCRYFSSYYFQGSEITLNGVVFGENGVVLAADSFTTSTQQMNRLLIKDFTLNFGQSDSLKKAKRFSVQLQRDPANRHYHGHGMWMSFLSSEDHWMRGIERSAAQKMVWDLGEALIGDDEELRYIALERLFYYSPTYKEFSREGRFEHGFEDLNHPTPKRRYRPTREDLFPHDSRIELVEPLLWLLERTETERERVLIALALGWFGERKAVPALIDSYENRTGLERLAAAASLGILGDDRGLDEVIAALKCENEDIRHNAVWTLVEVGGEKAAPVFEEALYHQKPWSEPAPRGGSCGHNPYGQTRQNIIRGFLALDDPDNAAILKRLLKRKEEYRIDHDSVRGITAMLELYKNGESPLAKSE